MRRPELVALAVGLPLGLLWSASRSADAPGDLAARARASLSRYWPDERYFPLAYSRTKVEEVAVQQLILEPAGP